VRRQEPRTSCKATWQRDSDYTGGRNLGPGIELTPVRSLANVSPAIRHVGAVTVAVDGDPRRYPVDVYRASIQILLTTNSMQLYSAISPRARVDPGANDYSWSWSATPPSRTGRPRSMGVLQPVAFEATRPIGRQLFVLSLVLVPFALGVLALPLLWSRSTSDASKATEARVTGLLSVTAVMLAILPIRSALVPPEIGSPTLVDLALGAEMALLAAALAFELRAHFYFGSGRYAGRRGLLAR
jgi:Domain of unknown function (DUF4436)